MKLIIGNKNYSSWSLRPWLLLSHHHLEFHEERIPLDTGNFEENLKAYTDAGLVPVLLDGDLRVWDSIAICEYISEKYLGEHGWPADLDARATARSCSAEMHAGFAHIRAGMPMNARTTNRKAEITPAINREIERIEQLWTHLRNRFSDKGPWLFGDFSIADCMYAPMAFRFNTYGVELSGAANEYQRSLLNHPWMQAWLEASRQESEVLARSEVGK